MTIRKADQTITFGALANRTLGDPDLTVGATASSGLPVSFGAVGGCTVAGTKVHLTAPGSCTITASQSGNANYNAATNVARAFTVGTFRARAQAVVTALQALPAINKDTDKKIDDAIDHLGKSLDPKLWNADGIHLDTDGRKAFDEAKAAVKSLLDIKNPSAALRDLIAGWVTSLESVGRSLAQTVISEATDARKVAEAKKELDKAQDELDKDHDEQAFDHWKNAWDKVTK